MSRLYTATKGGVVVRRGTFNDEKLLREDLPAPEYVLIFDEHLPFPPPPSTYADLRRMAYPPMTDFADALYWQSQGDSSKLDAYHAAVAEVKARFPKI